MNKILIALLCVIFGACSSSGAWKATIEEWPINSRDNWQKRCLVNLLYSSASAMDVDIEIFDRGAKDTDFKLKEMTRYNTLVDDVSIRWKTENEVIVKLYFKGSKGEKKVVERSYKYDSELKSFISQDRL